MLLVTVPVTALPLEPAPPTTALPGPRGEDPPLPDPPPLAAEPVLFRPPDPDARRRMRLLQATMRLLLEPQQHQQQPQQEANPI